MKRAAALTCLTEFLFTAVSRKKKGTMKEQGIGHKMYRPSNTAKKEEGYWPQVVPPNVTVVERVGCQVSRYRLP